MNIEALTQKCCLSMLRVEHQHAGRVSLSLGPVLEASMKLEWNKPVVTEQEVGLEVTSYLPAELDRS